MKIKVGDIFYENLGIASFYQVVKVYESGRVRIRKIEKEEKETECGYEFLATPIPNKFCPKEERYIDVKNNDKGFIKLVKYIDKEPIIEFSASYAHLYKGEPIISSYWYVWVR